MKSTIPILHEELTNSGKSIYKIEREEGREGREREREKKKERESYEYFRMCLCDICAFFNFLMKHSHFKALNVNSIVFCSFGNGPWNE